MVQQKVTAPALERVRQLLGNAAEDTHFAALWLIAHTGLRGGEALGLRWTDVDVVERQVLVRQAVVETGDGRHLGDPKSKSGVRDIPISGATVDVLMAHRTVQEAHKERMGRRYRDMNLVFPTMYGTPNRTSTLNYALRKYAPELHVHQLRHFAATQLMELGVALPRVAALLGHSSIGVTAGIYIHPNAAGDRDAMELLTVRVDDSNGCAMDVQAVEGLFSNTEMTPLR